MEGQNRKFDASPVFYWKLVNVYRSCTLFWSNGFSQYVKQKGSSF